MTTWSRDDPAFYCIKIRVAISVNLYQISADLIERSILMSEFVQQRVTDAEALDMLQHMSTAELMGRADAIRRLRDAIDRARPPTGSIFRN